MLADTPIELFFSPAQKLERSLVQYLCLDCRFETRFLDHLSRVARERLTGHRSNRWHLTQGEWIVTAKCNPVGTERFDQLIEHGSVVCEWIKINSSSLLL